MRVGLSMIDMFDVLKNMNKEYVKSITESTQKNKFAVTCIQKEFLKDYDYSGILLRIEKKIDQITINSVLSAMIHKHPYLRSTLSKDKKNWIEYNCPENLVIPFQDISEMDIENQNKYLDRVIRDFYLLKYDSIGSLCYRIAYIRLSDEISYLIMPVAHAIFDMMSASIVQRDIYNTFQKIKISGKCVLEVDDDLHDLIRIMKTGPKNRTDQDICSYYSLQTFSQVSNNLSFYVKNSFKQIPFCFEANFKVSLGKHIRDSIYIISNLCAKIFSIQEIPIWCINANRIAENRVFDNSIGAFIDMIPIVTIPSSGAESIEKEIIPRLLKKTSANINFSYLMHDKKIRKKYPLSGGYLEKAKNGFSIICNITQSSEFADMDELSELVYKYSQNRLKDSILINIEYQHDNIKLICFSSHQLDDHLISNAINDMHGTVKNINTTGRNV